MRSADGQDSVTRPDNDLLAGYADGVNAWLGSNLSGDHLMV